MQRRYVYEGGFLFGKRNGKGIVTFANGDKYEGFFFNDIIHGQGKAFSGMI